MLGGPSVVQELGGSRTGSLGGDLIFLRLLDLVDRGNQAPLFLAVEGKG